MQCSRQARRAGAHLAWHEREALGRLGRGSRGSGARRGQTRPLLSHACHQPSDALLEVARNKRLTQRSSCSCSLALRTASGVEVGSLTLSASARLRVCSLCVARTATVLAGVARAGTRVDNGAASFGFCLLLVGAAVAGGGGDDDEDAGGGRETTGGAGIACRVAAAAALDRSATTRGVLQTAGVAINCVTPESDATGIGTMTSSLGRKFVGLLLSMNSGLILHEPSACQ